MPAKKSAPVAEARPKAGLVRLEQPELVGELTIAEAAELKARQDLIAHFTDEYKKIQEQNLTVQRTLALLQNERQQLVTMLCEQRQLTTRDQYNVNEVTGQILRIAVYVDDTAPAEEEPAVVE